MKIKEQKLKIIFTLYFIFVPLGTKMRSYDVESMYLRSKFAWEHIPDHFKDNEAFIYDCVKTKAKVYYDSGVWVEKTDTSKMLEHRYHVLPRPGK